MKKTKWVNVPRAIRNKAKSKAKDEPVFDEALMARPEPPDIMAAPSTKGFIKCQADSFGCPNRATHWLLENGRPRAMACRTHAEMAKAKKIQTLAFK